MGPELEMTGESKPTMEVAASKENGSVPTNAQEKLINCSSNYEDDALNLETLLDEQAKVINASEDIEANITECTNSSYHWAVEAECQDATENSSSFGDTESGNENASMVSDAEVESPFFGGNAMRKKKLTDHWRRFIRPLMWRCKWLELQIKELNSQALKYDKEIVEFDQRKQIEFGDIPLEDVDSRSRPFSCQLRRKNVMQRKRRKRVEETTDIASYMSHHNLFSYYENKRSIANGGTMDDAVGNVDSKATNVTDEFGFSDRWSSLESRDDDSSLEQILLKIEVAQSQLRKLRTRVDKVVSENPGKFSSVNRLSLLVPCGAMTSSDQNPASPLNGDKLEIRSIYSSSQRMSELNMEDLWMPETAVSSHGEVTPVPDMIESTGQPQVGGSKENIEQGIQTNSEAAKEELHNFERVLGRITETPQMPPNRPNFTTPPTEAPETELPSTTSAPCPHPHGKSPSTSWSNIRRNKRKRMRQRSGSGSGCRTKRSSR